MRNLFLKTMIFIATMSLAGCGIEDKPMPLDKSTVETFMVALAKRGQSHPTTSESPAENVVRLYKDVIEDDVGYSFDRTLNRALVLQDVLSSSLFNPLTVAVASNSEHLKDRNVITPDTAELVALKRSASGVDITPERMELFDIIRRCRKNGGGACDATSLTLLIIDSDEGAQKALNQKLTYSALTPATPYDRQHALEAYVEWKYRLSGMGGLCRTGLIKTNWAPDVGDCGLILFEGVRGGRPATSIDLDEDKYRIIVKYNDRVLRIMSDAR